MEGRDSKGRFVKGHRPFNKKNPGGRPERNTEEKYLRVFSDTVTEQDLEDIILAVMARAKAQDMVAARIILEYALGKPAQRVDVTSAGEKLPSVNIYLPKVDELEAEPGTTGEVSS